MNRQNSVEIIDYLSIYLFKSILCQSSYQSAHECATGSSSKLCHSLVFSFFTETHTAHGRDTVIKKKACGLD